jgi:two-component system OmpR family sensor kinase
MKVVGVARSARIGIFIAYVVLLALVAVASTFATRQILVNRLNDQVSDTLEQEVLEFEQLIEVGRSPETSRPYGSVQELLAVFVERQVARNDEAILTYAEGRFFRGKIESFPLDRLPPAQEQAFAALSSRTAVTGETKGTFETRLGDARYRVRRVVIGDTTGAFVVALLPVGELAVIDELQSWDIVAMLAVLLFLASVIAWIVVRLVTRTRPIRN